MVHFNKDVGNVAARQRFLIRSMLRIDPSTRARLSMKFDVCYLLAKEGLPFKKYPKLIEIWLIEMTLQPKHSFIT